MAEKNIGELPELTELDDLDQLVARSVGDVVTGRISVATLRAAMGGGSPDRIESPSGEAFVEATDSFRGLGTPASQSEAIARGAGASSGAYTLPKGADKAVAEAALFAGTAAMTNGASIKAKYDSDTGERRLVAEGAPLEVPTPTAPNHAATKGYVDARPGAAAWSEHAATEDVDLDGHKLTGLGEPTDAADAATKGYVDGAAPAKIEWPWTSGGSNGGRAIEKVGGTGLRMVRQSQYYGTNPDNGSIVEVGIADNNNGPAYLRSRGDGYMPSGSRVEAHRAYFLLEVTGGVSALGRCKIQGIDGMITVQGRDAAPFQLMSPDYLTLPAGVEAVTHGIHLAKQAHDRLPDLEWWEPVWTPVSNVDSVTNVECSYTRAYRAAGGSLVTLEGTIEVTPSVADTMTMVSVDLPVPRDGADIIGGIGSFTDYDGDDFGLARVGVADLGAGQQVSVQYTPSTNAVHRVSFRISYRAA